MIYRSDTDRRSFLSLLGELEARYGVSVLAYVLMGNHYHLILRQEAGRLGEAMQFLDGTHARRFNHFHERTGALFGGRYDARLLESEVGVQGGGFYVHLNPVSASLVAHPVQYRWSSALAYRTEQSPFSWLRLELLAGQSGQEYTASMLASRGLWAGDAAAAAGEPVAFDRWHETTRELAAFSESDRAVATQLGVSVDELYEVGRGRLNIARMVGITHAHERIGASAAKVAERYGLRDRSGVYAARRRLRELVASHAEIARVAQALGLDL